MLIMYWFVSERSCSDQQVATSLLFALTSGYDLVEGSEERYPVSILYKSIAGRYRPVKVADGPITAHYRFIKNASWVVRWTTKRLVIPNQKQSLNH